MLNTAQNQFVEMDSLESDIIKTLLYFDVFTFPLLEEEIVKYLSQPKINADELNGVLNKLVAQEYIFKHDNFYSLNDENIDVIRRLKGNKHAEKLLKTAKWVSSFISYFPFVRGVFISGTLSKKYADEESDIDFFIITKPNKLWIARTFLIAFKKIFLLNSKKYFCVNYFIDSDHLEISDKNIYTATELLTLIPMYNFELLEKFLASNNWTEKFLPNYQIEKSMNKNYPPTKEIFVKKILEKMLAGSFGNWMDNFFLKLTLNRLKRKFLNLNDDEFELALRSKKYISKNHPKNYQKNVLKILEDKIETFENEFNVRLSNG